MIKYPLGYRGYYGACAFSKEANKLIEEYNSKINTFIIDKQNYRFMKRINEKIAKTLRGE